MHTFVRTILSTIPFFGAYRLVRVSDLARLQENNRLLAEAGTETARKLQEREAELTNAINVMLRRLTRLSEHNRWLAETIDSATTTEPALLSGAVIQRLQDIEESIQTL